ncbi:MAG: chromosome segregation protein SMC [Desulfobacteraceae bacterium]|nr:chromosome segregation protein SMC [Desulfobacteraceae bacterium]
MKIKKLDIIGFKSFQEKASITFPFGISAIVGPNGCGKSNVIDALRWVMGEQSIKQLRGKAKEDIIFSGSNGKAPLNMAEVTITLGNENGQAPEEFKDFSEISVTRRLFRSGESTYLINRQPCRLKDIYNLFMGSGVGSRTFAIIQQGNIGAIIDAGPDERRLFIEEAAGVTRYKFRKNEALKKVKSTEQNLLRINDIIAEVNRQMAGLKRQAKKAERYQTYKDRIKALDIRLLLHYHMDYNKQIGETETLLKQLKDTDLNHVAQLKKIDAAVEDIKLKHWQKNQEISTRKSEKFNFQRKIDRLETDRSHLKSEIERLVIESEALTKSHAELKDKTATIGDEVLDVETQNRRVSEQIEAGQSQIANRQSDAEQLQKEVSTLKQQVDQHKSRVMTLATEEARLKNIFQTASNNKENIKRRLKRIDEEVVLASRKTAAIEKELSKNQDGYDQIKQTLEALKKQVESLKSELEIKSAELRRQIKRTNQIEIERNKIRSEFTALKKMASNFQWYKDGVKTVMQARMKYNDSEDTPNKLKGIIGLVADIIEPDPGYETAVEAVLGEALQYILVTDQQSGLKAIDYLQTNRKGRSGFIPCQQLQLLQAKDQTPLSPGANRLLDHVRVQPDYVAAAQTLLGHVAVVENLNDALHLFNQKGRFQTIVTLQGNVISHQGVLIGGSKDQLAGILAKKNELKELEKQTAALDRDLVQAQELQSSLEDTARGLESELQQHSVKKQKYSQEAVEAEKLLYRLTEDLKNARHYLKMMTTEQDELLGEESDVEEEITKHNRALEEFSNQIKTSQDLTAETANRAAQLSSRFEHSNKLIVDQKLNLTALQAKLENGIQTLKRIKEFERDSHLRMEQLEREISLKNEKRIKAQKDMDDAESCLQEHYNSLKELENLLSNNETEYSEIDAVLKQNDNRISAIRSEREQTLKKIRIVELDLSEKRIKQENIASKALERYHNHLNELRKQIDGDQDALAQMTVDELEKELKNFRSKISTIGDVNLGAIQEYEELKKRFDFLSEQREDLVKAIEDLHKVIRKINRITQQRFLETFNQVNEKLQKVFPKLFEGGAAKLYLTEPGKPLETGVEYMVHPPGKKLTRMSLLSGGEKALSAIAFIFSIFLIRPASFCLLDEIDAPLDEANVIRFNNLMQVIGDKSQIIMITHNKKTMEFADMLFGVTMEQKGESKIVSVNLRN